MVDTTRQQVPATGGQPPRPRSHRRRWFLGAGLGGAALLGGGAWWLASDDDEPQRTEPRPWTPRPHVPAAQLDTKWVGVQTHTVSVAEEFEEWLGRPMDCVVVFGSETDWNAITGPWFAIDAPRGQDWSGWVADAPDERTLVISTAMVPKDPPSDWRARGAAGEYDEHWRAFGRNLVDVGLGSSIVRLGWEMNGTWYETHYIGEDEERREDWKEYFRRAVMAMEVDGSDFEIDFNIAEGPQNSVGIEDMYPGDDWVDIIGVDVYDSYIAPIDPGARWQAKGEKVNSVQYVADFAASVDKPISFPEWAMVAEGDTQGGGDSPAFIDQMADVVASERVRYQAYFNVPEGGVGMTLADAPEGSAVFRERFGPSGDAAPERA